MQKGEIELRGDYSEFINKYIVDELNKFGMKLDNLEKQIKDLQTNKPRGRKR